jgi:hypothetical protein
MRQIGLGGARATAAMINAGRTISTVEVRLFEQRGKLAVVGLVTLVDATALERAVDYSGAEPFEFRRCSLDSNWHGATPIVATLQMPTVLEMWEVTNRGCHVSGMSAWASPVVTPWRELHATGPELLVSSATSVTAPRSRRGFRPTSRWPFRIAICPCGSSPTLRLIAP